MVFDKTYLLKETGTACWDLGTEYKRNHQYKIVLIFLRLCLYIALQNSICCFESNFSWFGEVVCYLTTKHRNSCVLEWN